MEAQIANVPNNPQFGDDLKPDGASYVNALLNHKQLITVKNNKENIMDNTTEPQAQRNTSDDNKQIDSDISKIMGDDDGTFTPVINNSRKDRKVEKHRKQKNMHNGMIDKNDFHEKTDKKDSLSSKDKHKDSSAKEKKNQIQRDHSPDSSESQTDVKKVFVAAPLPKTNPWQVKNTVPTNVNEPPMEKKVLQPQKQEVSINGTNPGVSSVNLKEKKQPVQKVRIYLQKNH